LASFNRTIKELKRTSSATVTLPSLSFNRTIKELKQRQMKVIQENAETFNRTIKELKLDKQNKEQTEQILLIAPSRN